MAGSSHDFEKLPWRRIEGALMSIGRNVRQGFDRALADVGLSLPVSQLLAYIAEVEPQTQVQLAQRFATNRAVTGARIDRLEARGAVQRRAHPTDRRVWLVHITDKGQELVETINEIDRGFRTQLRAGITRAERQQLAKIVIRMQENLDAMTEADGVPAAPSRSTPSVDR